MIYRALCSFSRIFNTRIIGHLVGMARCAVPARVQRAEHMLEDTRIAVPLAPLNAARTAQRAPLPLSLIDDVHIGQALPLSSFGGEGWGEEALYLAAIHGRTGCTQIMRKLENQTYLPPTRKEANPKTTVGKQIHSWARHVNDLLSPALSSKGGEGDRVRCSSHPNSMAVGPGLRRAEAGSVAQAGWGGPAV